MDESRNVPASNRFGRRQKTFLKFSVRPNGFSAIVPSLEARFSLVPGGIVVSNSESVTRWLQGVKAESPRS
jgi:hypothetical protein